MNDETLELLKAIVAKIDNHVKLTALETKSLSYAVKRMIINDLRTSGKYQLARDLEAHYGIR